MSRRGENIRKRKDGRWEGRYIKGYDSKKQKARYASVYGKTYAETKQKLDEAKYKSSIGVVYVDAKNKLFGEIINSWFNAKKINLKPSSIIKYQNLIEKHILPELGHRKLRELNADLFYTFLDAQQKNGNKKNGGMLSTSSLQTMLYILNATIKYAASNNMVAYFSICLTRSGKEATPIQTLEQHEEDALDLFLSTHISRRNLGIMLSLYCGLRIGEVCALQWTDIDTKNAILYVRRTVQRIAHSSGKTKTKIHVGSPKSKSSIRVIPIYRKFGINVDDTITDIKCDVSDRHFCGKCVVIVSFQSKKIVYKPRNMSVDFFWMKVANWISDIDNQIEVRAANVLVGNDYGFVEWIEADLNLCKEEIEKYIYRCGNLLGVVSLLGGSDFHYENVICSGATPILIDVETLILPSVKQIYANDHNSLQLDVYMRTQFMRTLLLPKWIGNSPENAIDIGGFSAVHNNGINLPKDFEGRIVEFGELPELFIKGYKDVLKTILEHKAEYLELIEDVKSINFRYILRNTRVYYNLLRYFSNPIYLKNNNIFSCVTSRIFTPYLLIGNEEVTREMWPVGQVEYDEIKKFHIPIFSVNGNSTDLMGPDGKIVLKNYFYISPYNYVSETIELLDDQLIDIQIRYLLDVINVHNVQKKNSYNWQISYFDIKRKWMSINNKSSLFEYCNNLLASIQSAVSNCTLNEELELYFAPVKDSRTGRYSMDIMKDALYSGRYGVQIFLEMYYHFYGFEQRKKALENRVLKMANDFYLNTNEMKWFNLSFTNGVASLLMELRNFALISNRNSFVEMIFKIIKSIPEKNITRSEESDYYNGIAGLLYIICDCYKKFNVDIDLYARNLIEYIVTDLFKRCDICGLWFQEEFYHQPLTGLAHGQSGYALALSKALPYINEGMRLKVTSQIQKCMDYEYNCYDNSEMNLPDYRKLLLKKGGDKSQKKFMYGYCSGILGTALVVSELSEELISFQKKEIWKMNAVQYLKKDILIGNDSLCCGTAGWIDYLASCHKNEEWSDELLKKIIFSINEQGYVFNGLEGVNEISLFKGMSGIGYSVLRYMGKYPSVLL